MEKEEVTVEGAAGSDAYYSTYASVGDKYANKLSLFFSTGYQTTGGYPSGFVSTANIFASPAPTCSVTASPSWAAWIRGISPMTGAF
jgi:hypothetical protein